MPGPAAVAEDRLRVAVAAVQLLKFVTVVVDGVMILWRALGRDRPAGQGRGPYAYRQLGPREPKLELKLT